MLNGLIVLNKPAGMTSADCVYQLRKLLGIKKIGHAGTLDPNVEGVLPIAVGQATKLIDFLHERPKSYHGTGLIGIATTTDDLDGTVVAEKSVTRELSRAEIADTFTRFLGKIQQTPPMYSAVKVNGRKLYEYAREGESVTVPPRTIQIYQLTLLKTHFLDQKQTFEFEVTCSKGTYIRTLIKDIGTALGYPATMQELQRTSSGGFSLEQAVSLSQLETSENPDHYLIPIEAVLKEFVNVTLTNEQMEKVQNGATIKLPNSTESDVTLSYNGKVKAIYQRLRGYIYFPKLMLLKNE